MTSARQRARREAFRSLQLQLPLIQRDLSTHVRYWCSRIFPDFLFRQDEGEEYDDQAVVDAWLCASLNKKKKKKRDDESEACQQGGRHRGGGGRQQDGQVRPHQEIRHGTVRRGKKPHMRMADDKHGAMERAHYSCIRAYVSMYSGRTLVRVAQICHLNVPSGAHFHIIASLVNVLRT